MPDLYSPYSRDTQYEVGFTMSLMYITGVMFGIPDRRFHSCPTQPTSLIKKPNQVNIFHPTAWTLFQTLFKFIHCSDKSIAKIDLQLVRYNQN